MSGMRTIAGPLMLGVLVACAEPPQGLARTVQGSGPQIVFELDRRPLPELPFPNDIATRPDDSSPTGLRVNEKVLVCDVDSGSRFETYIFKGEPGSGIIGINGAAARLTAPGNTVLIMSFCHMTAEEMAEHHPKVAIIGEGNRIDRMIEYAPH